MFPYLHSVAYSLFAFIPVALKFQTVLRFHSFILLAGGTILDHLGGLKESILNDKSIPAAGEIEYINEGLWAVLRTISQIRINFRLKKIAKNDRAVSN